MFFLMLLLRCSLDDLDGYCTVYLFNNFIVYNDFIKLLKTFMVLFFVVYLIIIYNFHNSISKVPMAEYLILIFLCFFSLVMIIISNHLFVIFLFLEIVNICLYCLIGLNKNSNKGIEAAYKYFIQSSFATIMGFFAISLIYLFAGTLFLNELLILLNGQNLAWVLQFSLYILISVVFFKLGLFPLHSWVPDVYQGSYLIVMIFIATLPKLAYIFLFLKIFSIAPCLLVWYCLCIALISILYGSIIALYQVSFKRLLAYGSIVHIGFILYALSLYTAESIAAAVFYLLVYIILMVFVFCFMFFLWEKGDKGLFFLDDIGRLSNVLNKNKLLSLYFAYVILSLAGLPFFIGFISKWYIFASLLAKGLFIDLIILIGSSVLSSVYYIRLIRFLYFIENKDKKVKFYTTVKLSTSFYFLIVFLFILNILIIFYHNWIYLYILKCILSFFS
jgi:NADH-quinone oxidoreductase subunit N